jgi:hypothetical protein
MIIFLILLFCFSLCALVCIKSTFSIAIKSLLIVVLLISSLISFKLLEFYIGKPVIKKIPSAEVIVYGQVVDLKEKKIYILSTEIDGSLPADYIEYPYYEKLHKALEEGRKSKKGKPFLLKTKDKGDPREGDKANGKKSSEQGKKGSSLSLESKTFEIHDLPPPVLPKKED